MLMVRCDAPKASGHYKNQANTTFKSIQLHPLAFPRHNVNTTAPQNTVGRANIEKALASKK